MDSNTIGEDILFFLYRNHYFNKRHTPISNLCNNLQSTYNPCKYIKKELSNLNKMHLINFKKTHHGKDVFLNVKKKGKIEKILSDRLDALYSL